MRAERTEFAGEGMIIVSCIRPPIDGRDIVIEMHRNDKRVAHLMATRDELSGWAKDLAAFAKELPAGKRARIRALSDCPECDDCGVPDGPAQLTRCGHVGCTRCEGAE